MRRASVRRVSAAIPQLRGPLGRFGHAVVKAEHVALEPVEADAVAVQKRPVVPSLGDQCVCECQHHGRVGAGRHRMPLNGQKLREVVAHGAEQHEVDPAVGRGAQVVAHGMAAQAAVFHRGVL